MSLAVGDAARREDGTLGVVCYVGNGSVKLLLEDGSIAYEINPSALARPSEAELAAAPWPAEPRLGEDTGWVKVGTALRAGRSSLGVVCDGPDYDGRVELLLEDGSTTGSIKASALARPSEAELAAALWTAECWAVWVKVGAAARREDGTLGVVYDGPDYKGEVKLLLEDGSTTGFLLASALARPSEVELAAAPWLAEPRLGEDTGWVKAGTALRAGSKVGATTADPVDGKVQLSWPDGSVSELLPLAALGRPFAHELLTRIHANDWSAVAKTATPLACKEADTKGDRALHHLLRAAPKGAHAQMVEQAQQGAVPRGSLVELLSWLGMSVDEVEEAVYVLKEGVNRGAFDYPESGMDAQYHSGHWIASGNSVTTVPELAQINAATLTDAIRRMDLAPEAEKVFREVVSGLAAASSASAEGAQAEPETETQRDAGAEPEI
eukprot:COSAG06_NODE_1070_length_10820_cov_4.675494_1_plen_438_part_10